MARRSKIEPVRKYLRNERDLIRTKIDEACDVEDYTQAEYLKGFREILTNAIQLCEEGKPKEVKNEQRTP